MEWGKLYGSWYQHEKTIGLPLSAKGLWLDCFAWSVQQNTCGRLPKRLVNQIAGMNEGSEGWTLASLLVDAGLWEDDGAHYQMHDWEDHQPDADALARRRELTKERMRRLRGRLRESDSDAPQEDVTRHSDARDAARVEKSRREIREPRVSIETLGSEVCDLPDARAQVDEEHDETRPPCPPNPDPSRKPKRQPSQPKTPSEPKISPEVRSLAGEVWDRLDPKPLCGYVRVQQACDEMLRAGYSPQAVRLVASATVGWSRDVLQATFQRAGIDPKAPEPIEATSPDADLRGLIDAWNVNCGSLPPCSEVPVAPAEREILLRLLADAKGNLALIGAAASEAALDEFNRRTHLGLVSFARGFADKWRGMGERELENRAQHQRVIEVDRIRTEKFHRENREKLAKGETKVSPETAAWLKEMADIDLSAYVDRESA